MVQKRKTHVWIIVRMRLQRNRFGEKSPEPACEVTYEKENRDRTAERPERRREKAGCKSRNMELGEMACVYRCCGSDLDAGYFHQCKDPFRVDGKHDHDEKPCDRVPFFLLV